MEKYIKNNFTKALFIIIMFFAGTLSTMAQEVQATSVVAENVPVEDTRTIAEWSVFSGTQIFAMLMLIMIIQIAVVIALSDVIKNLLKSDKFRDRMKNGFKTIAVLIGLSVLYPSSANAAGISPEANSIIQLSDTMFWALVSINVVLLLVIFYLMNFMKWVLREMNPQIDAEALKETWWNKLMAKMTDAVPVEKEDVVMTDHEYDGIRELDNNLPPWWVWGFYVTIAFAFVYIFHFHVFKTGDLQAAEYDKEIANAKAEVEAYLKTQANNVDEFTVTILTDGGAIAEGKTIFEANCATCHKADGGGQAGPNLTDDYWIHGGDIKDVFKTIKYGFLSKSMPSWQDKLNPSQMQKVASYVKSLRGSNPAGGKGPEGELYKEDEKASEEKQEPVSDTLATEADTLK